MCQQHVMLWKNIGLVGVATKVARFMRPLGAQFEGVCMPKCRTNKRLSTYTSFFTFLYLSLCSSLVAKLSLQSFMDRFRKDK